VFHVYLLDSLPAASRLESEDLTERGKLMEWNFFFSRQPHGDPGYNARAINHASLSLIDDAATM